MTHPDAPARSVQLSDGSVWELVNPELAHSNWNLLSAPTITSEELGYTEDDPRRMDGLTLTAADHRAIADLLDPQPSSDGLASHITRFELIDHRESQPPMKQGRIFVLWDATVEPVYQDDGRTLKVFLHDLKAPTADGGTT